MYDINSLIAILFRIINFCFFVGIAIYFFKKKVLTATKQKINENEVYQKSLQEQERMLENQYFRLDDQLRAQNEKCHRLLSKVTLWKVASDALHAKKNQECHRNKERMAVRNDLIQTLINNQRFEKEALQKALSKTKQDLQKKFSDESVSRSFIHDIIMNLDRKTDDRT
ncbi:MAG: hypothetical protein ACOYT8_02505 [Candidatus Dependentiae bacterium]